jgi:hypothetical protein
VKYGARGRWRVKMLRRGVRCNNRIFGDPIRGVRKKCFVLGRGHGKRAARKRKRVRRCKCIASRRCPRVVRRVRRYRGCRRWYPKPGKYVGRKCGYKRKIGCNARGKRCVVANRAWLAGWEQFTIVKLRL